MTNQNINLFRRSDFTNMGIALGDAYLLLEKLGGNKIDKSKTELLKTFLGSNTTRSLAKATQNRKRPAELTVYFSWYQFDVEKNRYAQVRTGGGRRSRAVDRNIKLDDLLQIAKDFFFPNEHNSKGPISKFKIALGGPDMSEIENKLRFRINEHEERVEDFTVDGYLRKYGLKVAKLNLLTMVDSPQEKLNNKERENLNNTPLVIEDSEDDFELPSINYSTPMSQVSMFINIIYLLLLF